MFQLIAMVNIPGKAPGKRIGLVRFYETGYYPTNYDHSSWTTEEVQQFVDDYNEQLGLSKAVAESAFDASMFGWHVPAAEPAIEFFKAESLKR